MLQKGAQPIRGEIRETDNLRKGVRIPGLVQVVEAAMSREVGELRTSTNQDAVRSRSTRRLYEFFAGGGMARAGLGQGWSCVFANDIDPKKSASYAKNWGDTALHLADVAALSTADLPGTADLAWASFPCQDLSLAGSGTGLRGRRSGTFWPFWKLIASLNNEGRAPRSIVLENVCGALTSHHGRDFSTIGSAIAHAGYRFGALVVDAVYFVPQSRPRLFIIAIHKDQPIPERLLERQSGRGPLTDAQPTDRWYTSALKNAYHRLPDHARGSWLWWHLPLPAKRPAAFSQLTEETPTGVTWHTHAETQRLLSMMSRVNLDKVRAAQSLGRKIVGTIYKRTRPVGHGVKVQRAEVRFDGVAGCLRTPVGGSSRQTIIVVDGDSIRSRLLSPREAVRLMGLPEHYRLPTNYNEAYHLAGDGVVVPVVRHIAMHILEPVVDGSAQNEQEAA